MTKVTSKAAPVTAADVEQAQKVLAAVVVDSDPDLAYEAAHQAMVAKRRHRLLEERAVRLGRKGGVSWDILGGWLTVPGETLRRRYGGDRA